MRALSPSARMLPAKTASAPSCWPTARRSILAPSGRAALTGRTRTPSTVPNSAETSSVIPSVKYAVAESAPMCVNGSTAMSVGAPMPEARLEPHARAAVTMPATNRIVAAAAVPHRQRRIVVRLTANGVVVSLGRDSRSLSTAAARSRSPAVAGDAVDELTPPDGGIRSSSAAMPRARSFTTLSGSLSYSRRSRTFNCSYSATARSSASREPPAFRAFSR